FCRPNISRIPICYAAVSSVCCSSDLPDLFYWAERSGFDLMLSGHNHGGQIRFPLVGAVFMPSVFSRRFDRGFFRKRGLTLHVSRSVERGEGRWVVGEVS